MHTARLVSMAQYHSNVPCRSGARRTSLTPVRRGSPAGPFAAAFAENHIKILLRPHADDCQGTTPSSTSQSGTTTCAPQNDHHVTLVVWGIRRGKTMFVSSNLPENLPAPSALEGEASTSILKDSVDRTQTRECGLRRQSECKNSVSHQMVRAPSGTQNGPFSDHRNRPGLCPGRAQC